MTYELKDNVLDAPDYGDWTQKEIDYAIDDLAYKVECKGRWWDENYDYKLDLVNKILAINFTKDLDRQDKGYEISSLISEYVLKWAKAEVEENPDAYCEREELDKSDYYREVA